MRTFAVVCRLLASPTQSRSRRFSTQVRQLRLEQVLRLAESYL